MVSLYSLIIFFFVLVILFTMVSMVLSLAGWLQKKWIGRKTIPAPESIQAIDFRIDRLKALTFNISVVLVLFCITPFVIIYLFIL